MSEQQSILSLSWDQIKESPGFSEANEEQKAAAINQYHAQIAQYLKDNGASDQRLEAVEANRRARLYEVVPLLKQPEDIGVLENTVNAFTKSLGSFKENIYFNLLDQNPEEAQRYRRNLEREYPTAPGIAETVGRITGQMIPTGAALLAAPLTAGTSLSAISTIAAGSFYGASAAGGALGDIYAYEQATGEDVSSGKTAAVMAGHAVFEIGMEMVSLRTLTGIARRAGAGIGTDAAAELGNSILRRSKSETAAKAADAITDYFTHNKAARLALGWVGMGATEGLGEGATQIAQNVTDKLYRERDSLDGVMQSMGEGSLGGLLLGPLAIGVQMNAESGYHARVAAQGEEVLESAFLNEARKRAGATGSITAARDEVRTEYGRVDEALLRDPDFLFLKEYRGMAGVELVPVTGGTKLARGAQMTKADGTPVALVNAEYVKKQRDSLGFIDSHEFVHAIGLDNAIRISLDITEKLPGFESYKQRIQQVYAANQLGTLSDASIANELVADVIGVVANRPDFLGTLIDSVSANPEVARTTVTKLRDMRGRLEKMGRRVDAWLTTPENDKYTGLPRAAMQAAQGRINAETVALDAMIGQFTAGFEKALAQAEQPAEGAQIVGGTEEPEDVLAAAGVADKLEEPPFSASEGSYRPSTPYQPSAFRYADPETGPIQWAESNIRVPAQPNPPRLREDGKVILVGRTEYPLGQMKAAEKAVARMGEQAALVAQRNAVFKQALADSVALAKRLSEETGEPVVVERSNRSEAHYFSVGKFNWRVAQHFSRMSQIPGNFVNAPVDESAVRLRASGSWMDTPFSPAEGMTPDDVFARNFSTERTEAKATPEGKAIKEAWEEYKGTSYALSKVFLGDTKFEPPNPENREAVAQYNALPEWAKSKDGRGVQWGSQEMEDTFNEFLGITMLPGETAMGFLDQQGLRPSEGETGTNFDAATETLAKLARDYKTKGEFRRAIAAMAKDEVKGTLSDLVTRKANADIQARRIDKRTMLKIAQTPALVDKLVNEPKLNTVQRLVSRDDMQPGIVVRQGDNLYAVRSIAPDRVPEMVNLRGGRAFDYTEVAVDDPMADPEMAKDYRFGMELPPVVPYYGVQAAFPASASVEVQDMIDDMPAGDAVPFSPAEGMTPIDSFLAPKGSLMRETYDMKAKAAEAHRILNSNGASTFAQKAANLGKADTAEAGVAGFARQILMQESMEMLANPDQGRRERFFGTSDPELMKAKVIEIADERHIFYSETAVELVSAQFDANGNHLPPTEQRRFGDWMEWISHTFGMAGQRDVKKMNLTKEKVEKADAVRDAMDDLIADLANLPKAEFEPALQSRVARIREAAFRAQIARVKAGAPLSAAEAGEGDLAARVFADPGVYYRRLKGKTGAAFRDEIERTYGPGAADLMAEQLEAHIAMFPDLAGKPKRAPTVTEEAEIDLINEMLNGHEKKLEALKASIYTGEVGQFITENFRARLPQLNLRLAALSASMTPEEQGAEIDKAFREIAKTILEEKKKERGGAALVQQGLLSVEGIEASLAEAKEAVKARQVAFTAIAPAVNMALRNASVSIADLLKVSQQKVGRIQFNLGQQIAGKVTEELLKMPELAEFPEAIDAAAQKVADSVEAYIAKRLEDSVDTIGNESMATWNKANRAARGLVRPLLDLFYGPVQGPKPYAETAKGTAAALLAEPALFRARVEAALAEQKAKGDLLENDVLGEMARGLGLPANATWDQIATTLTAKPIPDALARRVIAEHMAQTGGSILELADVLSPSADSAFERVVDDLTREFGEGTRALWRDALTKQVEARRAIIAKRILSKRKEKGQKVNAYDKMIRAIAGGMFDDETMALALAESVGLPELTQETRDALRPLLAAEVAALRAYGPDDPITHRATDAISGLLARELIKSWPKKGWFTKLDEQRLKSAFYSGALSGFRTWAVTNPASSWAKTFQTILETAAKNALLDPVLKKQGLQGVAAALSHMIRTMSLDASRLALREGIAPQSIERGPYLDAKVPESGLWDTDANANVVHKTLFSMWGLAAKYVRRAIMAGDASPYQSGFSFGSYEAARKIVLMEAEAAGETLSLAETQRRVYDKLALGPDGKPTAAQMEQAKAELAQAGVTPSDAEVRLRAESIARRSRPDYVNAAGRFLGEQGTFTNDVGVHYAQVEGMPGEPGLGQRLLNWVNSAKNSSNPAVALLTTAVVPFPGIASRILDQSMNYLALPGYFRWRALNGLAETAETPAHRAAYAEAAGLQMVRMVEGTIALAVMALLVAMQDEDDPWLQITGAGPADFRKNYQWREAGNRPMTVKLGEAQVDYRWSPLASLLFAVGTWQDQKLEDPDDRKGLVTAAAMGFMTSTFNQSFMSSVADLLDVISGRDEQGAQQKLFSLLGNPVSSIVVPFSGAVRTVEQAFFPYPNAARVEDNFFKTFAKTTIARIPIMNELLPRKMNALGRAIETDRPFEADVSWKGWRRGGDEDANKVFDYVVEKQAWLPTPNALRTHVLPPESDMTKGEARRLADKDDALMTYAEYEKFMQRRGDIAIALFQKHEALLRTLPEGEAAREVMSELMSLASTQAKREAVGLRPFKPGVQPDRVIRSAVKRAAE